MVAQNQEIQQSENISAQQSENVSSTTSSESNLLVGGVIIFVVFVLAGGGYFLLQQLRAKQEGLHGALDKEDKRVIEITRQISSFQSQIAALQSHMATIDQKLATQDSQFERTMSQHAERYDENLSKTRKDFDEELQRIHRQLGKTRGDWLVADAEYLLGVANERLHLVGDVKTSLLALESADQRLRESGDPAVFKIRDVLVKEINILKTLKTPDIVGLSSRLRGLEAKVPKIPLFLPHRGKIEETKSQVPSQEPQPDAQEWDQFFDSAVEDLKGLVKVKRTDRPVDVVLLPEQAAMFREELRLKLEIARVALIQRNEQLYRNNLEAALNWLSQHFDTEADETKATISEINALKDISIDIEFPELGESLVMLRNVTKLRMETDKAMRPMESGKGR